MNPTAQERDALFDLYKSLTPEGQRSCFARIFGAFEYDPVTFAKMQYHIEDVSSFEWSQK